MAAVDLSQVQSGVDRAIRAAVPPEQMVERRVRPESSFSWSEPTPAAGLQAALTVVRLAQQQAYKFVLGLRGEATSWTEAADLLDIPWSSEYSRPERAYELVLGPPPEEEGSRFHARSLSWRCGGPLGCGEYIIDYGPYNGHPADNEKGHAANCRRRAAQGEAYERQCEERDERARVMDEAWPKVSDDFGRATVERAWWVQAHGGRYQGWSTSETLAVALVLGDDVVLKQHGYPKRREAMQRIVSGVSDPPSNPIKWLALLRAAATGLTS
jgi:hypothetical protein